MAFQPETINVREHHEYLLNNLWKALQFLDMCKGQPNSGETGAYRDALEWLESAAREVCEGIPIKPR